MAAGWIALLLAVGMWPTPLADGPMDRNLQGEGQELPVVERLDERHVEALIVSQSV